jgi:hypothetical protein
MGNYPLRFVLFTVCSLFSQQNFGAYTEINEGNIEVVMRMIGHQILLNAGDSTSRVWPIEKEGNRYRILFESEFLFQPNQLVATIDSVVKSNNIASGYLVEIEDCKTDQVVHSYKIGYTNRMDIIPCGPRAQPTGSYSILFTILNTGGLKASTSSAKSPQYSTLASLSLIILGIGYGIFIWMRRSRAKYDPDMIIIGKYAFDKRNMLLSHNNQTVDLTSKEAELLFLLYSSANTTLERDHILSQVWGDQGDYIGRTLDVFISKLRKKLESDPDIKIANIRGVGYRLVLNQAS